MVPTVSKQAAVYIMCWIVAQNGLHVNTCLYTKSSCLDFWHVVTLSVHNTSHSQNAESPWWMRHLKQQDTVYPKKYAHGFCFAVLCCGYTLTDFPISIRLTSLALWQSNDCPSANKATLMNMDKYFTWIHYERLHNHNKAKHNKTLCIFIGIYCKNVAWILLIFWLLYRDCYSWSFTKNIQIINSVA